MCHDIPEHSTAVALATNTGFGTHKMCAAGAHFSKRKTQIQKIIFAPKAHLHSSAKVRYLDFCMSAYSTDRYELQSATTLRGPPLRPPPPLPSLAPHPLQAARPRTSAPRRTPPTCHRSFLATDTGFGNHKSAPQAHFSPRENKEQKLNSKN